MEWVGGKRPVMAPSGSGAVLYRLSFVTGARILVGTTLSERGEARRLACSIKVQTVVGACSASLVLREPIDGVFTVLAGRPVLVLLGRQWPSGPGAMAGFRFRIGYATGAGRRCWVQVNPTGGGIEANARIVIGKLDGARRGRRDATSCRPGS